jgi:hypothetical protein
MSCKKGGFVNFRHNELHNITAKFLDDVCKDVATEPLLIPLNGEQLEHKTANTQNEARADVSATGFWVKGQRAFLDIRVFDPNATRYQNQNIQQCYLKNESEKNIYATCFFNLRWKRKGSENILLSPGRTNCMQTKNRHVTC